MLKALVNNLTKPLTINLFRLIIFWRLVYTLRQRGHTVIAPSQILFMIRYYAIDKCLRFSCYYYLVVLSSQKSNYRLKASYEHIISSLRGLFLLFIKSHRMSSPRLHLRRRHNFPCASTEPEVWSSLGSWNGTGTFWRGETNLCQ